MAARRAKADRRSDYERVIREIVRRIQSNEAVTDAQRSALGCGTGVSPVIASDRSRPPPPRRPRGVIGAEVWVKISEPGRPRPGPPSDPGELTFLLLSTRTPAVAEFTGPDRGKTAHYMLRWLNTRGETGPWSETASATVGAQEPGLPVRPWQDRIQSTWLASILETSFLSACVSTRTSPKSVAWRETSIEWWQTQAPRHELYVSDEVVAELAAPDFVQGPAALEMLRGLRLLELGPEVRGLAEILVREKVMPGPAVSGDALHVAAATAHGMDYVLTWNVQHMANPNKRTHFATLCLRLGLMPPQIVTPDLLVEADE